MDRFNLILDTDQYKSSHYLQYPPKTTDLVAYLESRGGLYDKTVFFGLQYILKKYLTQRVSTDDVREAEAFFTTHGLPFNTKGWMYIAKKLKGRIPLRIYAVPEGTVVPIRNILMRVESTDPKVFWTVGWFETLLMRVWYPITVATRSWHIRQLIYEYLKKTADDPENEVWFKLHDFGARGVSTAESASIGGAAHLVNFTGSDTIFGLLCARDYYHAKTIPSSIPAAEHSMIMVWGKDHEEEAFRHIFTELAKKGALIALPSDTFDMQRAISQIWGKKLRSLISSSGKILVVRTDSGDPKTVVLNALNILEKAYGTSINKKGYKVLKHVRVIHSDSVTQETVSDVLQTITQHRYSSTNVVFGMGGALLQQVNRDTLGFAYKVCLATVAGKDIPVTKSTATDPLKQSKGGYLDLIKTTGEFQTVAREKNTEEESKLVFIFENGRLLIEYDLETVRKNAIIV